MLTKTLQQRYLNFPVKVGAQKRQVSILVDGRLLHDFVIELAEDAPDFWVYLDMREQQGRHAVLQINPPLEENGPPVDPVILSDARFGLEDLYQEPLRPQFHFSARRGWLNDPNGLVYYGRTYHLFFQHNPYGVAWGNMHWGHAVSADLVHWQEQEEALYPDALGTMFSGSAVVDWRNTSGFQQGEHPPIVLIYTAAGGASSWSGGQPSTQCLAYSTDGGKTFQKYAANPVLPWIEGGNRDPKVIWHAPTQRWVMALYLDGDRYALLTSPDLKQWTQTDTFAIPGAWECPDIFALPVDGDPDTIRWVLWSADASYLVGQFDGQRFQAESVVTGGQHSGSAYAAQTYADVPAEDGRVIQVGWLRGDLPGMPFNQQMAFPVSLSLRSTPGGPRLCYQPVREIERLHGARHTFGPSELRPGENLLAGLPHAPTLGAYDLRLELEPGQAEAVVLAVRGIELVYDTTEQVLRCQDKSAPVRLVDGRLQLQALVDCASLEIFACQGEVYLPLHAHFAPGDRALALTARGGPAQVCSLDVFELRSIWA